MGVDFLSKDNILQAEYKAREPMLVFSRCLLAIGVGVAGENTHSVPTGGCETDK